MMLLRFSRSFSSSASAAAATASASSSAANRTPEMILQELKLSLPKPSSPKGSYVMCVRSGNLIFTAGHIPVLNDKGDVMKGKVGKDLTDEQGAEAAKICALSILSTLKNEIKELSNIERVVKIVGFVNCVDGFDRQPKIINGCSDLLGTVLGQKGFHARSAVGTNALPLNVPVEIECIVQVKE